MFFFILKFYLSINNIQWLHQESYKVPVTWQYLILNVILKSIEISLNLKRSLTLTVRFEIKLKISQVLHLTTVLKLKYEIVEQLIRVSELSPFDSSCNFLKSNKIGKSHIRWWFFFFTNIGYSKDQHKKDDTYGLNEF